MKAIMFSICRVAKNMSRSSSFFVHHILFIALFFSSSIFGHYNRKPLNGFDEIVRLLQESEIKESRPPRPVQDMKWQHSQNLGVISGIAVDRAGRPVVIHRGDRVWTQETFDENFLYRDTAKGPIGQNTVLTLNPETGVVEHGWGSNYFYLPHGLYIDPSGDYWITDVAMHQVFKFSNKGEKHNLVLGEKFVPGDDTKHFCQPTSTVVTSEGEIVVADGYCNNRLLVFDAQGNVVHVIPRRGVFVNFAIPHDLTIREKGDVCVADRENMRVVCLDASSRRFQDSPRDLPLAIHRPDLGRVFGVAALGDFVYAINGPTSPMLRVQGFTLNPETESVIEGWGPRYERFSNPHAIAVCPNGSALYVAENGPNLVWKFNLLAPSDALENDYNRDLETNYYY